MAPRMGTVPVLPRTGGCAVDRAVGSALAQEEEPAGLPGEALRIPLEGLGMLFESVLFMWWSQEKGSRSAAFPMQLQLVLSRRRLLWAVRMLCWASKVGK